MLPHLRNFSGVGVQIVCDGPDWSPMMVKIQTSAAVIKRLLKHFLLSCKQIINMFESHDTSTQIVTKKKNILHTMLS